MKIYDITVSRVGFTTIKANSKEEAMEIAQEMGTDDFDWAIDVEVTDCQEIDTNN